MSAYSRIAVDPAGDLEFKLEKYLISWVGDVSTSSALDSG